MISLVSGIGALVCSFAYMVQYTLPIAIYGEPVTPLTFNIYSMAILYFLLLGVSYIFGMYGVYAAKEVSYRELGKIVAGIGCSSFVAIIFGNIFFDILIDLF